VDDGMLETHAGSSSATFAEAAQVIRASNREMALRLYDRALDLDPSNSAALFGLGSLALDSELLRAPPQHVVQRLRALCQAACGGGGGGATCPATLALLGRVELCSGNEGGARAAFHEAISISPSDDVAHCGLSQCEERWGTAESTERAYARAMAACPTSAEILSNFARWNEQEYLDSKDGGDGGAQHKGDDAELIPNNSECSKGAARGLGRGHDNGDQGRGGQGMRRRVDEAAGIYSKILELDPGNLNALIRLGAISEYRDNDFAAASRFLKQAVEADPLQAGALSRLGKLSMSRAVGNESEVREMLSLMTADEKRVWHAKCEIAASMLERALSIDPSDHPSLSTLGWYQVAVRRDGQAAARLLSRALREAPDDPRILQLYSKAMKMCGDSAMAEDAMDRSRVMRMVRSKGMTEAEAREQVRREAAEKQGKNARLRNSNLAQARLTDEVMFGKIDKRLLTDEDWQTSIGLQGGTVFNVTSLRAKGLIKIETEEQVRVPGHPTTNG
jgi:tetratricopeptide (TPR) repeat protein